MAKLGMAPRSNSLTLPEISGIQDMSGKNRKSKRKMSQQEKSYSLEEVVAEGVRNERNTLLTRSKTYDASVSKEVEKETVSIQRKTSVSDLAKHAMNFHRVFKDLSEDLLGTFSCSWQREMPYHGRLYIANHRICFYCSVLRREVKVIIPVLNITVLKKANTALLVPNGISIRTTEGEKFLFGSIRSRESAYQLLHSVCKHLKDNSQNYSPNAPSIISSEHLLELPLNSKESDANCNFSEKTDVTERIQIPHETSCEQQQQQVTKQQNAGQTTTSIRNWRNDLCRFNTIIAIYLFLVVLLLCSSGYIGLRIIQLEEQLTSMGAWPELDLQHRYKPS